MLAALQHVIMDLSSRGGLDIDAEIIMNVQLSDIFVKLRCVAITVLIPYRSHCCTMIFTAHTFIRAVHVTFYPLFTEFERFSYDQAYAVLRASIVVLTNGEGEDTVNDVISQREILIAVENHLRSPQGCA